MEASSNGGLSLSAGYPDDGDRLSSPLWSILPGRLGNQRETTCSDRSIYLRAYGDASNRFIAGWRLDIVNGKA